MAAFLPAANAIVDYRALGSPAALRLELQRLHDDAKAWEAKVSAPPLLHAPSMSPACAFHNNLDIP